MDIMDYIKNVFFPMMSKFDLDKRSMTESGLANDYIVSIFNDPDYTGSDHSQTSPVRNTVEVYDYNLNLIKIAYINMPRHKLASQGKDNSFYSIVQNPEYSITKVDRYESLKSNNTDIINN